VYSKDIRGAVRQMDTLIRYRKMFFKKNGGCIEGRSYIILIKKCVKYL
jgi:hypothetical protein